MEKAALTSAIRRGWSVSSAKRKWMEESEFGGAFWSIFLFAAGQFIRSFSFIIIVKPFSKGLSAVQASFTH
jgi:hypothetical protein